jgi:hypothetical protein
VLSSEEAERMENNHIIKREEAVSEALRLAPNTLKCAMIGGIFGALAGGSKGALVGLIVFGIIGYRIDNENEN